MKRKAYPSDLTQKQFKRLEPLLPQGRPGGRPRSVDLYEVLCAILYTLQNGNTWRALPHDFPKWQTVYWYFRRFEQDGSWAAINHVLVRKTRCAAGRTAEPSAAILDAQSVRCAPQAGPRGVDAAKRLMGRKRHVLVDVSGLLLFVLVTSANVQDHNGGRFVLNLARLRFPGIKLVWVDRGYQEGLIDWVKALCGWVIEIVRPPAGARGFQVLPRRWVVERSLAWLTRCRRLSRDFEARPQTTEAWCYLANIRLMLRRLDPC